jgi:hypothetical protein
MHASAVSTPARIACDKPWLTYLTALTDMSLSRGRWAQQHLLTLCFSMAGLERWQPLYFCFRAAGCHVIAVAD